MLDHHQSIAPRHGDLGATEVLRIDLLGLGGGVDPYLHFEGLLPL